jgi:hypothetical protein
MGRVLAKAKKKKKKKKKKKTRTVSDDTGVLEMLSVAGFPERPSMALDLVAFLAGIALIALGKSALRRYGEARHVPQTCRICSERRCASSCA